MKNSNGSFTHRKTDSDPCPGSGLCPKNGTVGTGICIPLEWSVNISDSTTVTTDLERSARYGDSNLYSPPCVCKPIRPKRSFPMKWNEIILWSHNRRSHFVIQGGVPARWKDFYYYNHGPIFEAVFSILTPFLKKKIKDRVSLNLRHFPSWVVEVVRRVPVSFSCDE